MSREAAPRELEVEAAGLVRAALTGDEFAIDRIVTRAYEDDVDWRSFATEVTYTAAFLLIVALGSKAQATALVDAWLDSMVRKRMAAASLPISPAGRYAVPERQCRDIHSSISASAGASAARVACASGWASACRLMRAAYPLRACRVACSSRNCRAASSMSLIASVMRAAGSSCSVAGSVRGGSVSSAGSVSGPSPACGWRSAACGWPVLSASWCPAAVQCDLGGGDGDGAG